MKKRTILIVLGSIALILGVCLVTIASLAIMSPPPQAGSDHAIKAENKPSLEYIDEVMNEDGVKVPQVKISPPSGSVGM